ncbi:hypothetical protein [Kitasatospora sp. A2-31]|uniref:hypothetical protein n=1 Tax=Kitasatospora sp. A2-31 TaxID=2916414 RepID=UPI001EEBD8D4|nr:hypothetical protein [Kitasatospora sp. A2-31]MCG6498222.1 hypothetical protein [Kitasatospora sp. A2-31]
MGWLVREQAGQDAFVIVHFPPQHAAEPVLPGSAALSVPQLGQLSGPSRLVFRLPPGTDRLPFTLEALLDWGALEPSLPRAARQPRGAVAADPDAAGRSGAAPQATETALELPYHLVLSPHPGGGWAHDIEPVTHAGRTELWHTRLGVRALDADGRPVVDEELVEDRYVRAVSSPGAAGTLPDLAAALRPTPAQRQTIVALSAAAPVEVDQLMLSARGGWLRAHGHWPDHPSLSAWHHVTTLGRDQFARITQEGVLFPFKHRAAWIDVTDRTIDENTGRPVAVLREYQFLLVREPVKHYADDDYEHHGREMPFTDVRIATLFTPASPRVLPDIDRRSDSPDSADPPFWIMNATSPGTVPFHLIGTDRAGTDTDFHAALVFVPLDLADDPGILAEIRARYRRGDPTDPSVQRRVDVGGAPVAFAPPVDRVRPGDTTLTTDALTFDVVIGHGPLPFLPVLESAQVRFPAVDRLLGTANPATVVPSPTYLADTDGNPAHLFAELTAPLEVKLPAERGAVLARPNMAVKGLSSTLGPVAGDLDALTAGRFDPAVFFADTAKLMGAVPLAQLISGVFEPRQFPQMFSRTTAMSVVTTLDWEPKVESTSALLHASDSGAPISLSLRARIEQSPGSEPDPPRTSVRTTLRDFTVGFAGVLEVRFDALTFRSENGAKPSVSVELPDHAVRLFSDLSFFSALADLIGGSGLAHAPTVDVSPAGVRASYSLPLPPVPLGVFLLENVRLGISLNLPFLDDRPSLRFAFGERNDEFLVTVEGLGGGGFFALALGLDGIETVEASLEVGAAVGLDFGVASGNVALMVGVYARYDALPVGRASVTGYQRQSGEVEVLGLVSASIDFYLGLTYATHPDRLEGTATLTIKVDLTLFSESVELTVRRVLVGGADPAGDPDFGDVTTEEDWRAYADAFA